MIRNSIRIPLFAIKKTKEMINKVVVRNILNILCILLTVNVVFSQQAGNCERINKIITEKFISNSIMELDWYMSAKSIHYEVNNSKDIYLKCTIPGFSMFRFVDTTFAYTRIGDEKLTVGIDNIWKSGVSNEFNYDEHIKMCEEVMELLKSGKSICNNPIKIDTLSTIDPYTYEPETRIVEIITLEIKDYIFNCYVDRQKQKLIKIEGGNGKDKSSLLITDYSSKLKIDMPKIGSQAFKYEGVGTPNRASILDYSSYRDGWVGLQLLIDNNIKYPEYSKHNKIEGTVDIVFFIEIDGSINNITIRRGLNAELDEEALRLIKLSSGLWKPCSHNGKKISCIKYLSIPFKIK